MVKDRTKFTIGLVGLVTFVIALTVFLSPVLEDRTGLQWADGFFNQLSKSSSYFLPKVSEESVDYAGKSFWAQVTAQDPVIAEHLERVFAVAGAQTRLQGNTVELAGDLGAVARAVIADAESMYRGRERELQAAYGFTGREAIYCWWTALDAIYRQFLAEGDIPTSNFASMLRTKVCEPAYNFVGIAPRSPSEAGLPLFALLSFYLLYTVWYGFSILYLFEGLGITAQASKREEQ